MSNQKKQIVEVLSRDPVDTEALRKLSRREGGFISNDLRARVWPKLLGINRYVIPDYKKFVSPHRDDRQIGCDVDRSFWSLDVAKNWSEKHLHRKRAILSDIITAVLCRHSRYYYFQGFHDIVSVLILVLNDSALAYAATEVLCDKYLFDFMRKDFSSLSKTMKLIMVLIKCADPQLAAFLESSGTEPFFATSWLITWLSHDIRNVGQAARMFDALICSPPEYCFYLCASLVLHHRDEIMELEPEFSTVHNTLSRLLRRSDPAEDPSLSGREKVLVDFSEKCVVDLEAVIALADSLLSKFPPNQVMRHADSSIKQVIQQSRLLLFNNCNDAPNVNSILKSCPDFLLLRGLRLRSLLGSSDLQLSAARRLVISIRGWSTHFCGDRRSEKTAQLPRRSILRSWEQMARNLASNILGENTNESKTESGGSGLLLLAVAGSVLSVGVYLLHSYHGTMISSNQQ